MSIQRHFNDYSTTLPRLFQELHEYVTTPALVVRGTVLYATPVCVRGV